MARRSTDTMKLCGFGLLLCIVVPYICPSFSILPLLPIGFAMCRGIGGERKIDGILCGVIYAAYFAVIAYPLSLAIPFIPYHWWLMWSYSLFPFVFNRDLLGIRSDTLSSSIWFRVWLTICFNVPLLIAFHIVSYLGGQLSAPLVTIIDDHICVGAFPCSKGNVETLRGAPYNIGAVVNLCDEMRGPVGEYEKYGIRYIQLNTLDTTV